MILQSNPKNEVIYMSSAKANLNIKIDKTVKETTAQPTPTLSLDEQILMAIKAKNIPEVTLECDENGNVIIDKDKHPELYDWAVNG
jgi:hypothetical protein